MRTAVCPDGLGCSSQGLLPAELAPSENAKHMPCEGFLWNSVGFRNEDCWWRTCGIISLDPNCTGHIAPTMQMRGLRPEVRFWLGYGAVLLRFHLLSPEPSLPVFVLLHIKCLKKATVDSVLLACHFGKSKLWLRTEGSGLDACVSQVQGACGCSPGCLVQCRVQPAPRLQGQHT